ncbi:Glycosyl transferase family 1 domain-containing protein [Bordetella tumbae]|uniref:glycosyltransferase n=1 Tax=Bordetella tumbae TaxID=1649139 RepID=UPI0039F128AA
MKIEVINSQVYGNPYQKLLYTAIDARYQIVSGTLSKAIKRQQATECSIYHIHWEESLFSRCTTVAQAARVRREYVKQLRDYIAIGGKVVWTLHNIKPHEWRFVRTLLSLRKDIAELSHRILVHNQTALSVLQEQTGLVDLSKVTVLPHPAYFDVYESVDRTIERAGRPAANPRTLLCFGLVRAYKGIPDLLRKLPQDFMVQHQLALHICGKPLRADSFLNDLLAQGSERPEITYTLTSIPVEEVAELFRSNAGLILPYHRVLTSGVAVLALTLGVPTIAPNTPAMRELFPESSHHLLFEPRSPKDLRRAVVALADMPGEIREQIAEDYIQQALLYHPQRVSGALGAIYDELIGLAGDNCWIRLWGRRPAMLDDVAAQSRVPFLLQLISGNRSMATRVSKAAAVALSNQQLALELVKATLVGNVRTGASDELILNNIKDVNTLTVERSRLDAAYAVRLYTNILNRLEQWSAGQDEK